MSTTLFPMPAFTEADPPIDGEGSLDPLGLASIADRLADQLLPGLRARMRRIRFLTAAAVGAHTSDDLFDRLPYDGVSLPSICFEWLVLEAFARAPAAGSPLESAGVPGSSKVRAVLARNQRLTARNYLKSPNVFGFTGVFLPLARHLQILDDQRMPGPQLVPLLRAWEVDQSLQGFTDNTPGTPGYRFRSRLNEQVAEGLKRGHCTEPSGSRLWKQICNSLHPVGAGPQERQLLTDRFLSPDLPVTAWLADSVRDLDDLDELSLVMHLRGTRPPGDVQMRLEAIERYEEVCRILDAAFRQIRRVSTHRGTKPVDGTTFASDEVLTEVSQLLPSRMELAMTAVGRLNGELPLMLGDRLGRFEPAMSSSELAETLLVHHESVQSAKAPRGKRSWFDRQVSGWVVRSLYWNHDEVNLDSAMFLHPYRISALQTFMKDLSS